MKPGRDLQPPRPRSRFACERATTRLRHPGRPRGAAPRMRLLPTRRPRGAVANADNAVVEAQAALDKAAVDRRAGRASDVDREAARTALSQAQERVKQQKAELRRIEADASTPRPNVADGQVNVARAELAAAA